MDKEKEGVWRTIRGRRIFIRSGESLGEAMSKSGKFKRTEITDEKQGQSTMHRFGRSHLYKNKRKAEKEYHKGISKDLRYSNNVYDEDRQAQKNRIYEFDTSHLKAKTRVERNMPRYSEAQQRELRHEELQKRLAEYKDYKDAKADLPRLKRQRESMLNAMGNNREGLGTNYWGEKYKEASNYVKDAEQKIADYKAKKQSDNKVENNDLQNEYINYSKDLNLDPNKQSTKNKFLNDYGKNYVQYKGIKDYEQEMEKAKNTIDSFKAKKQSNNKIEKDLKAEGEKSYKERVSNKEKYIQDYKNKYGDIEIYDNKLKETQNLETMANDYIQYGGSQSFEDMVNHRIEISKENDNRYSVKQSNNKIDNEYHFAGEELYSDDPHRYDDTIKSAQARKEKFKADENFKKEKHIGWGSYNKDGVPVYENDIDYKGDFGWANLKTLSDDDLTKALNIQSEEYHKANAESVGDRRTRNGRMDKIFKDAKVGKYEQGMKKISEEMQKRDMPRYNIYDKKNPNNILVSSPTKEMADKQIQDMYKTDISLQKEYGWKELPKYDYRVGKVDENLNEIKDYVSKKKSNHTWEPKDIKMQKRGVKFRTPDDKNWL